MENVFFHIIVTYHQRKEKIIMSAELCGVLIIGSVFFCIYILRKIRYSEFKIEDSIFWICFSFLLILVSIFPQILTVGAEKLGIISPVNFVFLIIIFLLLLKSFLLSRKIAELEDKLKRLVQKIAKENVMEENKDC